ncbi:membrane protein [Streptomyces acidiscabies]|uniref:Membrane protein n=2 Tax=Streptomyces acidiscabies TaxID=42234 RepID=A0A0L0KMU1_9ACTN|nr:membrane protein [Streptomyces acidiscabies]
MRGMATKTEDSTGEISEVELTKGAEEDVTEEEPLTDDELLAEGGEPEPKETSYVGQGAAAVVSAALGFVSLSGSWIGTVASARETLMGQLQTSSTASVATQVKEVYGDAWKTSAMWAGVFALVALVTAVVVLVRPAFGNPDKPQPGWIKSVAWGGVSLGVIGLLLAVLKYSDALLSLPSAS